MGWTCLLPVFWGPMPLRITAVGISGAAEGPYQAQLSRGGDQVEQNPVHHQCGKTEAGWGGSAWGSLLCPPTSHLNPESLQRSLATVDGAPGISRAQPGGRCIVVSVCG